MQLTESQSRILPLENGDQLTRHEFELRYHMSDLRKAELIEGIVYVASPLRIKSHGEPHGNLITWVGTYKAVTPGLVLGIEPTVRLDLANEPQPDVVLFIPGQQAVISDDDYIEGAPELIIEVAASSAAIDLHAKKQVYQRNQVQEYIVWRTLDQQLDWFRLQNNDDARIDLDRDKILRSQVFPGLWLDVEALLSNNLGQVLAVLQRGIQSPEHTEFVLKLQQQ